MLIKPITTLEGTAAPLGLDNVDTDQVIPARFLKGTSRDGMGEGLFYDLRFDKADQPKPDFVLNQPAHQNATLLIAGDNFGCGSSREHAPWALKDYGFQAVLAKSFADIFRNNSLKNGLLPIILPPPSIDTLLEAIQDNPALPITINLPEQTLTAAPIGTQPFTIDAFWKKCLVEGVDQVGYTLSHLQAIKTFEAQHEATWVYAAPLTALAKQAS